MTIYLPGAIFAAGISIFLFYEYNRVNQAKKDQRRETLDEKRQEYLQRLIAAKKKEHGPKENLSASRPEKENTEEARPDDIFPE